MVTGFLKDKLGKHEMVQALEIRPELPKTAVGKISKKDLYDEEARRRTGPSSGSRTITGFDVPHFRPVNCLVFTNMISALNGL